jgi:hypothetical protein
MTRLSAHNLCLQEHLPFAQLSFCHKPHTTPTTPQLCYELAAAMQALRKFVSEGKIILRAALSEVLVDEMRSLARHGNFIWTSDWISGLLEDDARVEADIPDQHARNLTVILWIFIKTLFPEAEAQDWQFIKTLAGSTDCIGRREFETDLSQVMNVCAIPGSILVATENDTFVYGYGWNVSMALTSNKKLITLNKGGILMCRGDYIYAPAGYQSNRVVLHAFLDMPTFERPAGHQPHLVMEYDDTVAQDNMFCFVWKCPFKTSGETSLRKHLNRFHGFRFNQGRHAAP